MGPQRHRRAARARDDELGERKSAEERLEALLELSEVLASSLDYEQSFQRLAEFVVPRMADGCVIDVIERSGVVRRPVAVIAAPEKRACAERLMHLRPPNPNSGFYRVVRDGLVFQPDVTEREIASGARDPEHASILRALDPRSVVGVTLAARGEAIGIMWVYMSESGRAYTHADVEVFEDLARRAALLLDNARLYEDAASAIAERDEFLSIAAHELRTPLTTLQLSLQSLTKIARVQGQGFDAASLSKLEMVERQGQRLRQIVEDLLDVSRLETGAIEQRLSEVDLSRLVADLAASFQPQAERFGCRLELDLEPGIVGRWDASGLDRVVQNLIANAFKFGRGHPVGVSLVRRDDHAILSVVDHGIGIAAADQARVFERFTRAVSARHYGGLGLGLWIAQKATEAMGGLIRVTSAAGQGATFTVELPLA